MIRAVSLAAAALLLVSCRSVEKAPSSDAGASLPSGEKQPRTSTPFNNDPDRFQFAIVTDRTGGHRPGIFEDAIAKLNLLEPEFVMSVGDLIEGYTENKEELDRQWNEFQSFTARLKMPFFYVPGNHDLSNLVEVEKWKERFGKLYSHFVYRDVLLLSLDSDDPPDTHISDEQIAYVQKTLEENAKVRWTLVFLHKPLWVIEERNAHSAGKGAPPAERDTGWPKIEALLANRPYTVFAGHFHRYSKYVRHDRRYFILATTGGASQLRGPAFGEFDHLAWVTMHRDGPVVANLMLGGIWDENVATEKSRAMVASLENAVRIGALFVGMNETAFGGGKVPIKITNDADVPLTVGGNFRESAPIWAEPRKIETTIAPNSVQEFEVKLAVAAPMKSAALSPLTLDLTLSYDVPDGPKLAVASTYTVAAEPIAPIPRRAAPITVDGNLEDWNKKLPFSCSRPQQILGDVDGWQGPNDASFRFGVQYDDKKLYIAVDTTDERLVALVDKPPWREDGVEIRLDARPDPERSQARQGDDKILFIAAAPGDTPELTAVPDREKLPAGAEIAAVKTKTGHATEVAIPIAYLDGIQGGPWKRVRLNVSVDDLDEESGKPTQIWWRPDWRTEQSYAGSGTFERKR